MADEGLRRGKTVFPELLCRQIFVETGSKHAAALHHEADASLLERLPVPVDHLDLALIDWDEMRDPVLAALFRKLPDVILGDGVAALPEHLHKVHADGDAVHIAAVELIARVLQNLQDSVSDISADRGHQYFSQCICPFSSSFQDFSSNIHPSLRYGIRLQRFSV